MAAVSVDARWLLGFPAPGHPYWTHATVAAVKAQLLGMGVVPCEVPVDE